MLRNDLTKAKDEAGCGKDKRIHFSKLTSGSNESHRTKTAVKWVELFKDEILESPDYTPKALVGLFERNLGKEFNADSGVWEKYSIKRHTLMVMGQFEKYFSKSDLPASISKRLFRALLALHDIGKPDAIKKTGDKANLPGAGCSKA